MKVAIFADQLLYRVPGGIATYVRSLATQLIRLDPEGEYLLFHCGRRGQRLGGAPEGAGQARVPGGRAALSLSWNYLGHPRVEGFLGRLDLLHSTQLVVPASRAPLVATVYDLFPLRYPQSLPARWRRLLLRGLEAVLRKARLILAISRYTADDLQSLLRPGDDRVRLVPLGVEKPPDTPPEAAKKVREERGLPQRYFIFVGTREPRKNLGRLLDAYLLARERKILEQEVGLVLVGPAGWGTGDFDQRAQAAPGVHVLGQVSREDLDLLLKGALALVYPSLAEGFGLPVLEAMVRGVPVITSGTTALKEVAEGAALLVDPLNILELAGAMEELCSDEARRMELARQGRERASRYSWEETARLTLWAYREAAS